MGNHPAARTARLALADRYLEMGDFLLVEYYLAPLLEDGSSTEQSTSAWLLLAEAMARAERFDLAGHCLKEVVRLSAGSTVTDRLVSDRGRPGESKTGEQWVKEMVRRHGQSLADHLESQQWPYGRVEFEHRTNNSRNSAAERIRYARSASIRPAKIQRAASPIPAHLRAGYEFRGNNTVVVKDAWGPRTNPYAWQHTSIEPVCQHIRNG